MQNMKKANPISLTAFVLSLIFCSCSNPPATNEQTNDSSTNAESDTAPLNELATFKFTYTLANLPSPLSVLDEFSKSGLPTDISLLNPADNVNNYHGSLKQAFNYGIYGVDLGYLIFNNRTLEALKYYSTAKNLASQLNMGDTFNRFVDRFESNSDNKDSLTQVIDEAYAATDAYLRSNERLITATQVLAGSWIECQHITVNLLKNTERTASNEMLYQRVWEQRSYLDNIIKIFDEFKNDAELMKIKNDFDKLLVLYKEPHNSQDISKDFLLRLSTNLDKVRSNIIK